MTVHRINTNDGGFAELNQEGFLAGWADDITSAEIFIDPPETSAETTVVGVSVTTANDVTVSASVNADTDTLEELLGELEVIVDE